MLVRRSEELSDTIQQMFASLQAMEADHDSLATILVPLGSVRG
jgi:hypothetical protein